MFYEFPEKIMARALEVIEPSFDITPYYNQLYVELDKAREEIERTENNVYKFLYKDIIKQYLQIDLKTNELYLPGQSYLKKKVFLTGFKGIGKTTELRKLMKQLNHPKGYYTVFISLGEVVDTFYFKYQDFFISIIMTLSRQLHKEKGLSSKAYLLDSIIEDWLTEKELIKEVEKSAKLEGELSSGVGFNLLNFFKTKFDLKGALEFNTKGARILRQKIENDLPTLIRNLNNALITIRPAIIEANKGLDLLFIIDDLEKINYNEFSKLFFKNRQTILGLETNLIVTVPVDTRFDPIDTQEKRHYLTTFFPPIRVDKKENRELLAEVVARRIDINTFFENKDALDFLIIKSGGILNQLFTMLRNTLIRTKGEKISLDFAKIMVKKEGRRMYEALTSEQIEVLKKLAKTGVFVPADPEASKLLYSSYVLKYNGTHIINPLIEDFFNN